MSESLLKDLMFLTNCIFALVKLLIWWVSTPMCCDIGSLNLNSHLTVLHLGSDCTESKWFGCFIKQWYTQRVTPYQVQDALYKRQRRHINFGVSSAGQNILALIEGLRPNQITKEILELAEQS